MSIVALVLSRTRGVEVEAYEGAEARAKATDEDESWGRV